MYICMKYEGAERRPRRWEHKSACGPSTRGRAWRARPCCARWQGTTAVSAKRTSKSRAGINAPCSNRGAPHGRVPRIVTQRLLWPSLACVQMSRARRRLFCLTNCSATKCSCATCAARGATPSRGDNHMAAPRTLALLADPPVGRPARAAQRSRLWLGPPLAPSSASHTQPTGRRRRSTPA